MLESDDLGGELAGGYQFDGNRGFSLDFFQVAEQQLPAAVLAVLAGLLDHWYRVECLLVGVPAGDADQAFFLVFYPYLVGIVDVVGDDDGLAVVVHQIPGVVEVAEDSNLSAPGGDGDVRAEQCVQLGGLGYFRSPAFGEKLAPHFQGAHVAAQAGLLVGDPGERAMRAAVVVLDLVLAKIQELLPGEKLLRLLAGGARLYCGLHILLQGEVHLALD